MIGAIENSYFDQGITEGKRLGTISLGLSG